MQRRTLLTGVISVALFGLLGCGSRGENLSDEEWNRRLVAAVEPLSHVSELSDFSYSMQGMLGRQDSAWVSGNVHSDTDDPALNEALLDEVGRQIATVHQSNGARRSWVKVFVQSPNLRRYQFHEWFDHQVVTLDDLAARYEIPRR